MPFFVVFDTCTHSKYYGDVHQVLALPEGAVIRYEYKRYLYSKDAAVALEELLAHPSRLPVPALLMYGEKQGFIHNDPEPTTMLSRADSFFIPTRSAYLVAVSVERSAANKDDVLYMHFQLRGFVHPDTPAIDQLVTALEAAHSLPFGNKNTEYCWISLLPQQLEGHVNALQSDDHANWTTVVDKFVNAPTQFSSDVFWRVRKLVKIKNGQPTDEVPLQDRRTNSRTEIESWFRDYRLLESERYAVAIQTYSPDGHGVAVPPNASIAMTSSDDDQELLKLAADPLQIVPNQIEHKRFSISTDAALDTRYTGVHLETQVPNRTDPYAAGSMCSLTFSVSKPSWRVGLGTLLTLAGGGIGIYTATAKPNLYWMIGLGTLAALLVVAGGYFLTKQFKFGK